MDKILELFKGLFIEPRATMYKAREPEYQKVTLILAALGVLVFGVASLFTPLNSVQGVIFGLVVGFLFLLINVSCIYIGGRITGGSGGFVPILQLVGLIWIPLALVGVLGDAFGLGLLASAVEWVVIYYLILIGHNFSGFNDVILALVVALILNFAADLAMEYYIGLGAKFLMGT